MAIARVNSVTMVNFNHVSVRSPVAGETHGSRCGSSDTRAPGAGKVHAGMKGIVAGEGIDAGAEAAGPFELAAENGGGERDVAHAIQQLIHLVQYGGGAQIGVLEPGIADAFEPERL